MSKVLANLEERGLVRRDQHPDDRRQVILGITDKGTELLASERRARDAWLTRHVAALSVDERDLLRRVVPILERLAEQ
jgi:DNA-binding MarR family transcriptional regulator